MTDLINRLRGMCDAGTSDYSIIGGSGTAQFWTDAQLESELDRQRTAHEREVMWSHTDYNNGTAVYTRYSWSEADVERAESGSAAWKIENSAGSAIGTASYTVNYDAKEVTFLADTEGESYYLSYRSYDMERAAANIWDMKAAHVAVQFDVKTDNHDLKRSQKATAYREMAQLYRNTAKPKHVRMTREDVW